MTAQVYPGFDNEIRLRLKAEGVPYDLSEVTKIEMIVGGRIVSSTNLQTDPIRWLQAEQESGEVSVFLGLLEPPLKPGLRKGYLVIYDSLHDDGLVWGSFTFGVLQLKNG